MTKFKWWTIAISGALMVTGYWNNGWEGVGAALMLIVFLAGFAFFWLIVLGVGLTALQAIVLFVRSVWRS